MSDSSSVQLYYLEESSFGVTPAAALNELRFTDDNLKLETGTTTSNEIRDDRQVAGHARTSVHAAGDVGVEFSYGAHDDLFEGILYSDWINAIDSTASLTFAGGSPNTTTTISTAASPALFVNVVAGGFVQLSGSAASPTRNGFFRVVEKVDNDTIRVQGVIPTGTESMRLRYSWLRNGTTRKSYTVEKKFADVSPLEFQAYTGMRVGTADLEIKLGSIITGKLAFMGKNMVAANATVGTGGPTAAPAWDVNNAVDNITGILIDGVDYSSTVGITSLSLSLSNALRVQNQLGTPYARGVGAGRFEAKGKLQAYFEDRTLLDKYLDFSSFTLSFRVVDGDGNTYLVDLPSLSPMNANTDTPGNNQDVFVDLEFAAKRDTTYDFMFGINRFAA